MDTREGLSMKTKKIVTLLAAVSIITGLTGCGSSNDNGNNKPANTAQTTDSSNTPATTTENEPAATNQQPAADEKKNLEISTIQGTWASPLPDPNGNGAKMINEK